MKTIFETDREFICDIQAPCFRDLGPEETEFIRSGKTQVLFRKGDNLTKQGAFTSYVLFLITGLAKQYLESNSTKTFNLRIIRPGEFLGLSAVFHGNVFGCSSSALTDCQAFLIEKEAIAKVIKQNGQFGFSLIRKYTEQNNNLLSVIRNLNHKQMNGRLSDTLLYLDALKTEYPEIFTLLSRKDLADFTGISTESTVKLLKTFEKDGLIELQDKDIVIKNHGILSEISKKG
ncbi:MAG TPA: Crp/Fnr family transcriptional regulator [Bacteroidales bacterium]|jgi:CRP/FNR family transcriptional regulator|nr:Crp/Fnr family transcriptional regulator [Bacteroidales bacterium]HOS70950.1 Crp/Fnr family transcriptional regulator [Bacteroidales bacterium]HQJ80882.1 Crp/Fnr family transcriptional regulator [Bacteroidales bacterium]